MKLFGIKDTRTKKLVPGTFFKDKSKAKDERNQLNMQEPGAYVVSFGPDHRRFKDK